MKTRDFFYELPKELIADTAVEPRDASRLLIVDRESRTLIDRRFSDIIDYINPNDVLVINNSKVLPARLLGQFTNGTEFEILLLNDRGDDIWECMVRPGKKLRVGAVVHYGDNELSAEVIEVLPDGNRLVKFSAPENDLMKCFYRFGRMPLPPYIKNSESEDGRYQTVYAKHLGSAAAPTAGLHFTQELLNSIEEKGISVAQVTLHVGVGTFKPVEAELVEDHVMHSEWYEVDEAAAKKINDAKKNGGRVIAVGTTATRTLEGLFAERGEIVASSGTTNIFITPGCRFNVIDKLITNFHLPQSTLLMLVSAFADKELMDIAYKYAIDERYRFYSFGDAMLIL